MKTLLRAAWVCVLAAGLAGCAIAPMGQPIPSVQNIAKARAAGIPPLALGEFTLAPGRDPSLDQWVSIRTNRIHSPFGSSFSASLKETFATDLRGAGLLDPSAPFVLSGQLTESTLDVPAGAASASVAARMILTRAGVRVYDRELRATSNWTAHFVGAEAIPMGINRYTSLYRQLATDLLDDAQFRAALGR
jgi:hypothetical protein